MPLMPFTFRRQGVSRGTGFRTRPPTNKQSLGSRSDRVIGSARDVCIGSKSEVSTRISDFRSSPNIGHHSSERPLPKSAHSGNRPCSITSETLAKTNQLDRYHK